jgi:putative ABC transport system substrate-binding protein
MRRRDLIAGLGGVAVWPLAGRAQQPVLPVIGYLSAGSRTTSRTAANAAALNKGQAESGYVEDRNVTLEYRFADGQYDRLPALAADLVQTPCVGDLAITFSGSRRRQSGNRYYTDRLCERV